MELLLVIPIMIGVLYLKTRHQRFFYYGKNPLEGHKPFIGFSTTEG